jgi:nicotinamidase-related amidase
MNEVIYLRTLQDSSVAPCLVLVDMQQEDVSGSRLMALPDAAAALDNCRAALEHARSKGYPVAFIRQVSRPSAYFNSATSFSGWISGFQPTRADMVFERESPSCYSSALFAQFMEGCGGRFALAGFAGETACLSTAIDAFHRGHGFSYLADASASHGLDDLSAADVHKAVTSIVGVYGDIVTTRDWIEESPTGAEMVRRRR